MQNPKLSNDAPSNTVKNPDNWVSGDDPMTGAQASYIATLSEEANKKLPDGEMTKADASKLIDTLKGEVAQG